MQISNSVVLEWDLRSFQVTPSRLVNCHFFRNQADPSSFTGLYLFRPLHFPGTIIAEMAQGKKIGAQWENVSEGVPQILSQSTTFSSPTGILLLLICCTNFSHCSCI